MKIQKTGTLLVAGALSLMVLTQCGSDAEKAVDDAGKKAGNVVDDAASKMKDTADKAGDKMDDMADKAEDTMDKMEGKTGDMNFAAGSVEAEIQNFMDNGSGSKTFTLDKVPFEGEDVSVDAKAQLDALAALLTAHPDMKGEVGCHTTAAKNAVGKTAKKTASKARALWVKLKLTTRGVDGKQLDAKGYGDTEPLAGVDGEDDSQKRIVVSLSK